MKNIFKFLTLFLVFMFSVNSGFAISVGKIDKTIKKSRLSETSTVAVSIRDVATGNVIYEINQNKLLHPASTLKIFSTYEALNVLGPDYFFKTQFYKDNENNLYIKLGADPLLTRAQLKQAFVDLKNAGHTSFNNLYFDDSIIDKKEFPVGWMWDDETKEETPKVSAYNLDGNVFKINVSKSADGVVSTDLKSKYPMAVVSNIKFSEDGKSLDIGRYNWNNPELVEIYGEVDKLSAITIPISSMRRYYIFNVDKNIEDMKINIKNTRYASVIVPDNAQLLTEISNPIAPTISPILVNSNNLMSESLFKLAGGKTFTSTGTSDLASITFYDFYNKNGIKTKNIVVKDGSGVSRNNLVSADWMSSTLAKLYKKDDFKKIKENMAQPGDGTLSERLFDIRGNALLKTGSLANVSNITGFVDSKDGKTYAFSLMIQNHNEENEFVKKFEDEIINLIYSK